ncbi:anthranilate synthase component 1 [Corynebacterium casei]|uniref:anthranilate synthase component 1 n=1 Tax=Corynebacterium casei TaxID=160386 RepID=UPI0026489BBF|nr:anthranilate synthase component 1 [Corynebacterium casei]MDN5706608.1 anthranilate synthase component 1 [Corynebacterium casei]MDN5798550.1 anthranilate synthase component 1 [Corynebacterium casei]MDN5921209.1 anthranilate synthase component 1 [Corynebacterium casei]MDN6245289.1 anthranilate synthase component 1 [Corynebacterium casei]MDN6285047.1 anthranilate synthase component 1 [Corynebacterium casei]
MTGFITASRALPYTTDAASLFDALATTHDSMLLESADIESKKNVQCLAVVDAALKVTCLGQRVRAQVLTPAGQAMLARLEEQLADYLVAPGEFAFEPSTDIDERRRLKAISNAEVLRKLQLDAGYSHEMLPFLGGGFAYDYLDTFEVLPEVRDGENEYPDYEFVVAQTLLHVDHLNQSIVLHGVDVDAAELEARLDKHLAKAQELFDAPAADTTDATDTSGAANEKTVTVTADILDKDFRKHVVNLQKNIYEGDIYQVVPARSFSMECPDAFAAYRKLRETNPSPYMFYIRGADYELIGASPESNLKFSADTREVQLYPIAGTRPRGATHELDIRNELDMRTDTKEVAEHTMLVDLARNDLARVAVPGTRRVADLLQVDRYSRVMHLVSRVVAELHPDFDAIDAYRACMNMGTLTGAPKLRAMELVRNTEKKRRGSYGGAVGYLRGDGSMDNCIVIRSAFIKNDTAIVQAGAGVVRDSVPQSEADETLHKAYAVLHAIAAANNATLEVVR